MPLRLVLDTSILIAATRSPDGAAAAVLELILARRVTLLLTYSLLREYHDVAQRSEHISASYLTQDEIATLLIALEDVGEGVDLIIWQRPLCIDPGDNKVLDVAINGNADLIATNNLRHIQEPARRFGIPVSSAKELLFTIREGGADATAQE